MPDVDTVLAFPSARTPSGAGDVPPAPPPLATGVTPPDPGVPELPLLPVLPVLATAPRLLADVCAEPVPVAVLVLGPVPGPGEDMRELSRTVSGPLLGDVDRGTGEGPGELGCGWPVAVNPIKVPDGIFPIGGLQIKQITCLHVKYSEI